MSPAPRLSEFLLLSTTERREAALQARTPRLSSPPTPTYLPQPPKPRVCAGQEGPRGAAVMSSPGSSPTGRAGWETGGVREGGPWNDGLFPSRPRDGVRVRGPTARVRDPAARAFPLRPDLLLQPRGALSHQPVHPPVSVSRNK